MSPKHPASVTAYLAAQPAPMRAVLASVRAAIRAAVPDAREDIAYGIPRYKLDGQMLMYFAGWKHHYALYPAYPSITHALTKELAPYAVVKRTIRIPSTEPVPAGLIGRFATLRAAEVRAATMKRVTTRAKKPVTTRAKIPATAKKPATRAKKR